MATVPTAEKGSRDRYYKRQKLEMKTLTTELDQLTAVLKREQALKSGEKKAKVDDAKLALARYHRRELFASERRRKWLQVAVKGKSLLIDDLLEVVRQQTRIARVIAAQGHQTHIYDLYKKTDAAFSACGLNPTSVDTTQFQRSITRSCDGIFIQNVRRQYLAFSYAQTCQSIWMLSHLMHWQQDREDFPDVNDPDNMIATKFRISKCLPGGDRVSLQKRFVLRQLKEDTWTILVWKAHSAGEKSWLGMETDEIGWAIIRPSPAVPGTVIEICLKLVPRNLNSEYVAPKLPGNPFDNCLQSIVQGDTEEVSNEANALLLEHMLTGIHA